MASSHTHSDPDSDSDSLGVSGSIVFSTVGRTEYGFDIFCVSLQDTATEHCLTDGISINFNGQFVDDNNTLVFISERNGVPQVYLTRPNSSDSPEKLPSAPRSLFHDRPILYGDCLYFVSAHEPTDSLYKSCSAVYSIQSNILTRLTPPGTADFSPALSPSGNFIAVASYGSNSWGGEFHELHTQIIVFPVCDPSKRTVLAQRGGWPTWSDDSTIYFHHQSEDGWWSIYRVHFPATHSPHRVTPPGVHAFTPAALHGNAAKKIAVATRRKDRFYRHIELFDTETAKFEPVTELLNPEFHNYNPFVSPNSKFLGYHRFRGTEQKKGDQFIPNLEPILSPINSLNMLRINGSFPSFSPDGNLIAYNNQDINNIANGGIKIMKSDGSKRWTLIKGQVAFYNSWAPSLVDKNNHVHVIFTSLGDIFQPAKTTVQIARITFNASSLHPNHTDVDNVKIKIMTKQDTGNNAFPACSPDGKLVVFRSGRSGYKNLYIMNAVEGEDSNNIRQLTDGPWIDTMPSWSPDGKLIAFSSNRHDPSNTVTFGIYLIAVDGSDLKRVHVSDVAMERINHVCFSPNGEWLLFTANMGGVTAEPVSFPNQFQPYGDLFIAKLDGTGLRRLTWSGYENGTPAWHSRQLLDIHLGNLSLEGIEKADAHHQVDADKLKGKFDEPLWITCDF